MDELKEKKIWFCWNYKENADGKLTKVPISYKNAETGVDEAHRETWCTYDEAISAVKKYGFDGVGFVIPKGYVGIDIDGRDLEDDIVKDILSIFGGKTYVEKSPSGKGLHIIGKVDLSKMPKDLLKRYYQKNKEINIECYIGGLTNRFFTFTGEECIYG